MSGATFSFEYPPRAAPDQAELEAIAIRVGGPITVDAHGTIELRGSRPPRRGLVFVSARPSQLGEQLRSQAFLRDAFTAQLGWIPARTVSGLAMSRDDRALLAELATAIVTAHGGHAIVERAPDHDAILIEAYDVVGTFGRFAADADYVRANFAHLTPARYWAIDVRSSPTAWVHC